MKIAGSPHEVRYYFANQFEFVGEKNVSYTGLQPRPDANGTSTIHGVFSSFIKGTATDDPDYCSPGADGGPSVSCAAEFPASYDHVYNLVISNSHGTTWVETMVDTTTGEKTHIGRYTLPKGRGLGKVILGDPFSESGGLQGIIDKPYEYGPCVGKFNFTSERTAKDDGWEMTVGPLP